MRLHRYAGMVALLIACIAFILHAMTLITWNVAGSGWLLPLAISYVPVFVYERRHPPDVVRLEKKHVFFRVFAGYVVALQLLWLAQLVWGVVQLKDPTTVSPVSM